MRTSLALAAAAALLGGLVASASPASAACGANVTTCTNVSFTVAAGTISLLAPTSASGGTATASGAGATVDISLGSTVVTASITSSGWHVDATASDFTPSSGPAIDKSNASFSVPGTPTAPTAGVLCSGANLVKKTTAVAVNPTTGTTTDIIYCTSPGLTGATFVPVLTVAVPAGSVAGSYTGTVTQSAY
ncbi:MAG: hypothetical protein QOE05_2865 [Actinomycetota bacterium]|jgi:hypothetical protein|nr:hypothetical protein [Actinomycetota bacterium]